ncbi:Uncharacterized protein Rs2_37616 [Raphanus sativus]|nr:Uncharacterized protein Rs2_37616 [Raphanus sativus]
MFKQNIVGENLVNRTLPLDAKSLFTKFSPTIFCLNVITTLTGRLNVIGASDQQNHNIGIELGAHTISFKMMDCEILFDDHSKFNSKLSDVKGIAPDNNNNRVLDPASSSSRPQGMLRKDSFRSAICSYISP